MNGPFLREVDESTGFSNALREFDSGGIHKGNHLTFIDRATIIHGVAIVEGWSTRCPHVMPRLYKGRYDCTLSSHRKPRPDLGEYHGRGFRVYGMVGDWPLDVTQLSISLGDEVVPWVTKADHDSADEHYFKMLSRLVVEVKKKPGARVLEIGSRARSGNVYKGVFGDDIEYVGCDIAAGPNVDVVADAHHLSRAVEGRFDFVFSISTFEHLLMPWKAVLEINKVCNIGALVLTQSHAAWPEHEVPWDFWRYSKYAWHGLFNKHTGFEIVEAGQAQTATLSPRYQIGGPSCAGMDLGLNYLASGCIARKIGEPMVEWEAEVGEVYNLGYNHGAVA